VGGDFFLRGLGPLHILRHTAATLALTAGVPVHIVAARLGDTPQTVLATYAPPVASVRRDRRRARGSRAHGMSGAPQSGAGLQPPTFLASQLTRPNPPSTPFGLMRQVSLPEWTSLR
jgi:hypothetical protein